MSQSIKSADNSLLILGVGQNAERILHLLNKTQFGQYKHAISGQPLPDIKYSFVDDDFSLDKLEFYWKHALPDKTLGEIGGYKGRGIKEEQSLC